MKEMKRDETRRSYAFIGVLGITVLALLILISSTASATTDQSASSVGPCAYITNFYSNTVSVIDTATNTVTATVPVESHPLALGQFVASLPAPASIFPIANFSANVTSGPVPLSVQFTDLSVNANDWNWKFGNGFTSIEQNPTHTYFFVGTYTVNLTASNENGTNSKLATINVSEKIVPIPPIADFSSSITSGYAPFSVQFIDRSKFATRLKWTFGDGTNSRLSDPIHKYSKAGNYTVALTASNSAGNNTMTKPNYIKVKAVTKPVAAFLASPTSGKAPLNVAFQDKSTNNPTSWKWTFGDGAKSSDQNPIYQYSQEGKYKVTLTVTNAAGSSTTTKTNYIKVTTNTRPGIYSKSK